VRQPKTCASSAPARATSQTASVTRLLTEGSAAAPNYVGRANGWLLALIGAGLSRPNLG
jgi:hypothetical protein